MFTHNIEALDYIHSALDTNKVTLGVTSVWYGEEDFTAPYPALVCTTGGLTRDYVATRTFEVILQIQIFVMHADLSVSHKTRTRADMLLADAVVDFIHTDYTLGGNIIHGWVSGENPGVFNRVKGNGIVSTSLAWIGRSRAPFGG